VLLADSPRLSSPPATSLRHTPRPRDRRPWPKLASGKLPSRRRPASRRSHSELAERFSKSASRTVNMRRAHPLPRKDGSSPQQGIPDFSPRDPTSPNSPSCPFGNCHTNRHPGMIGPWNDPRSGPSNPNVWKAVGNEANAAARTVEVVERAEGVVELVGNPLRSVVGSSQSSRMLW
jgi:hypothetical protein